MTDLSIPHTPLAIDELRRARVAARFGGTIHYFDSVDSTNTVAQNLARDGVAEGTVVIAETQTRGRGRLGRSWVSPPYRNLYLSIVLRPPIPVADAPCLALVAGLATAEAVAEWAPQASLKWPNDVLIDGRKVAGMLMELHSEDDHLAWIIAGIGVNLNMTAADLPADLHDKAVSLSTAVGRPIDRAVFAAALLAHFEARYDQFVQQGFAPLRPLWERRCCLQGRHIDVEDAGRHYGGIVRGIGDDGALLLRDDAGQEVSIVAGEVTVIGGYARRDQPKEQADG